MLLILAYCYVICIHRVDEEKVLLKIILSFDQYTLFFASSFMKEVIFRFTNTELIKQTKTSEYFQFTIFSS